MIMAREHEPCSLKDVVGRASLAEAGGAGDIVLARIRSLSEVSSASRLLCGSVDDV